MSAVFEAVGNNDVTALRAALKQGGDADEFAGALRNAAELGQLALLKCFVRHHVCDKWAIVAAASFASVEVVRYLYKSMGWDVNAALIGAAAHGKTENVRFLLTTEADVVDEALADAALRGYADIAELLMLAGANPYAEVYGGRTAVETARRKNDKRMRAVLEKAEISET